MKLQTCRRHPSAGRFMRTCSGCAQDLYDMQERNRALAAAPDALATIGTPHARILSAAFAHGALIVATEQPDSAAFPYAVDVFRPATADETDPDQVDPRAPGEWVLVEQLGGDAREEVDGMVAAARAYLTEIGIIPAPTDLAA